MIKGIDVSKWQGAVDWRKVAGHGIDFAMLRLGYGKKAGGGVADPTFKPNIAGAAAAGLKVGAYFYSYACSSEAAIREAEWAVAALEPHRTQLALPVAYDLEDDSQKNLGRAALTAMARAFCGAVRAAGYRPMLYSNLDWLKNRLDPGEIGAPIWLAQWADKPTYTGQYVMWQYTSTGRVDGISGNVDCNYYYEEDNMTVKDTRCASAPPK
jgi:GH25 family lysozyme M1 (1,4-beta-N-acetylmuramidase)